MNTPRVLITGANGPLGRKVADNLSRAGALVTGLSRKAAPAGFPGGWTSCDLLQRDAVLSALTSQEVVVHCASNVQNPQDDVDALDHLIAASRALGGRRIVYVSICGIDAAAETSAYYKMKIRNESALRQSGIPHSVVRIAQFYPFVATILSHLVFGPLILTPHIALQPVDMDFAAEQLASIALHPAEGLVTDVHGPETLALKDMATSWLRSRGSSKIRLWSPAFGLMKGFAAITAVQGKGGGSTWAQWLASSAATDNPYGEK